MQIKNSTVLVTGACGGIGSALLEELINRDAKKIYAASINIENLSSFKDKYPDKIVPIKLDVTNMDDVLSCRDNCLDVDMLINNAGVEFATGFLDEKSLKASQFEMAVNYFGVHNLCYSFWDSFKTKKSACIVNMLSVGSFVLIKKLATYCASKSAAHFLTQALRAEAKGSNIEIIGVYPGYVDTAMTTNIPVEKVTPKQIAIQTCDGIEKGELDIFPDQMSKDLVLSTNHSNKIFFDFTE